MEMARMIRHECIMIIWFTMKRLHWKAFYIWVSVVITLSSTSISQPLTFWSSTVGTGCCTIPNRTFFKDTSDVVPFVPFTQAGTIHFRCSNMANSQRQSGSQKLQSAKMFHCDEPDSINSIDCIPVEFHRPVDHTSESAGSSVRNT
jgi:hypothetical protein